MLLGGQCWQAGASPSTDLPNPIGKACTTCSDFATSLEQSPGLDWNNSKRTASLSPYGLGQCRT